MIGVKGATSFQGRSLVPALVAAGRQVWTTVRPWRNTALLKPPGVELAVGDVADRDSVRAAMAGCQHVVHARRMFHLWGEPRSFKRVNVENTACVLEAALRRR